MLFWFVLFWRRVALVAAVVLFATGGFATAFYTVWELLGVVVLIAIGAIAIGWVALTAPADLLRCVKSKQDYLWLAGGDASFLAQLPAWPSAYR